MLHLTTPSFQHPSSSLHFGNIFISPAKAQHNIKASPDTWHFHVCILLFYLLLFRTTKKMTCQVQLFIQAWVRSQLTPAFTKKYLYKYWQTIYQYMYFCPVEGNLMVILKMISCQGDLYLFFMDLQKILNGQIHHTLGLSACTVATPYLGVNSLNADCLTSALND